MSEDFDAVRQCRSWIENKRRYGAAHFTPTQVAILRQVESIAVEATQLLDRLNQMVAVIKRTEGQLAAADSSLAGLYAAFEDHEAKVA